MVFQFASTNLVVELAISVALLLGWQFVVGEFAGGLVMIVLLAALFRLFLRPQLVARAGAEAERGRAGSMEGHAEMDMSAGAGSWWRRLRTPAGLTATADYFVMDWAAIGRDIVAGLLIAGALAAWVPDAFWQGLFLAHHPLLAKLWGPLIAPLVAMLSFVCSVGNVPLAAVLWNGGISFGGVLTFIFADLDHPADRPHLRALLRRADGSFPRRQLLRDDGRRRSGRRDPPPWARARSAEPRRPRPRRRRRLELHDSI